MSESAFEKANRLRQERGIGLYEASRIVRREFLIERVRAAEKLEDLKLVLIDILEDSK